MQDVYIIASMAIVIMVCVWHAVVPLIYFHQGRPTASYCDAIVAATLGFAYFVAHIVFVVVIASRVIAVISITHTHTHTHTHTPV